MQACDNEFFEEYKKLGKICSDIYGCNDGVTAYIEEMKEKTDEGQRLVRSWDYDYKTLFHVRKVRNLIAHETSTCPFSDHEDLLFVKDFYSRILSVQDPLALLGKAIKEQNARRKQPSKQEKSADVPSPASRQEQPRVSAPTSQTRQPEKKSGKWIWFFIILELLAAALLLYSVSRLYG